MPSHLFALRLASSIAGLGCLAGAGLAYAEDSPSSAPTGFKPSERTINVYAVYGDGRATNGGDMHWRAYEVGFGDVLNDYLSVYLAYLNEGHPLDHHRDGFAAIGSFRWPVGNRLRSSCRRGRISAWTRHMSTTSRAMKAMGCARLGSGAVLPRSQPLLLKVQYNHVQMIDGFNSDAVLFGIGSDFGGDPGPLSDGKTQVGVWAGTSQTNRPQVPIEKGIWSKSSGRSAMRGPIRRASSTKAITASPAEEAWRRNSGMSRRSRANGRFRQVVPYLSHDRDEVASKTRLNALLSAQVTYQVTNDWAASLRFNVATGNDRNGTCSWSAWRQFLAARLAPNRHRPACE